MCQNSTKVCTVFRLFFKSVVKCFQIVHILLGAKPGAEVVIGYSIMGIFGWCLFSDNFEFPSYNIFPVTICSMID